MTKKNRSSLYAALLCAGVLTSAPAMAQDFASCKALRDPKAYGEKYDNYQYLLVGQDGWFFRTKQDLWTRYNFKKNVSAFQEFAHALKARGTELVIAYAPTRGMAASDKLPVNDPLEKGFNAPAVQKSYNDMIAAMNEAGIHVAGLSDLSQGETYFYKADHHWARPGAEAMARAVAAIAKDLDIYPSLPKTQYQLAPDKEKALIDGSFNGALEKLCGAKAPKQEDQMVHTGESAKDNEDALFGDANMPDVVLVGTSNSKKQNNDVHFDDLLKANLSTDVYNAAISGGGIDDSLLAYLASDAFQKKPAKLLIWEVPGYYDVDGEEMRKLLAQGTAAARGSCASPVAQAEQKLTGKNVRLFGELEPKNIQDAYVVLIFGKPFRKKFGIQTNYAGGETDSFRFERSNLYPADGRFYYELPNKGKAVSSVILKVPSKLEGMNVKAQLCVPDNAKSAAPDKSEKKTGALKSWWQKIKS